MSHFDEPADEAEKKALEDFEKLLEADLVEVLEGPQGEITGFRQHLIVPILADPNKLTGSKVSQLTYGMLTIGHMMDAEKKPNGAASALKLISDLTAIPEKVLRQLNPKDFQNAQVVAYLPFHGPPFLPTGRSA